MKYKILTIITSVFLLTGCNVRESVTKTIKDPIIEVSSPFKMESFIGCEESISIDFINDSHSRNYSLEKYYTSFQCDNDSGVFSHELSFNVPYFTDFYIDYNFKNETLNVVSYNEDIITLGDDRTQIERKLVRISKNMLSELKHFNTKKEAERKAKEEKLKLIKQG